MSESNDVSLRCALLYMECGAMLCGVYRCDFLGNFIVADSAIMCQRACVRDWFPLRMVHLRSAKITIVVIPRTFRCLNENHNQNVSFCVRRTFLSISVISAMMTVSGDSGLNRTIQLIRHFQSQQLLNLQMLRLISVPEIRRKS